MFWKSCFFRTPKPFFCVRQCRFLWALKDVISVSWLVYTAWNCNQVTRCEYMTTLLIRPLLLILEISYQLFTGTRLYKKALFSLVFSHTLWYHEFLEMMGENVTFAAGEFFLILYFKSSNKIIISPKSIDSVKIIRKRFKLIHEPWT